MRRLLCATIFISACGEGSALDRGDETGVGESSTSATESESPGLSAPQTPQTIVEGFALDISKPDPGTVLITWEDQGVSEYEVWSSSDPYFTPGDPGSAQVAEGPELEFSIAAGVTSYYRVRAPGAADALSTAAGQIQYDLFSVYTKLGVCLVSEVSTWTELQLDMPSSPSDAWMWDADIQNWVNSGVIWNRELEPGMVISVQHDTPPTPDEYTWVGLVPTENDASISLLPGDNLVTTLPLRFGPTMTSELLAMVPSATRIGEWDPATQTLIWHPDDGDWLLEPCSPIHVEVTEPSTWPPPAPPDDLPPDPSEVAPPLDRTASTSFYDSVSFLFEGDPPIQDGVAPGTIQTHRVSLLRGGVAQRDGGPVGGAAVSVLGHPEYGSTLTRADGRYDLAVNGGETLTVAIASDGALPVQRTVRVPWQGFVEVEPVALVALDPALTVIDFDDPIEVHLAEEASDGDGTRTAALLFREGTVATMVMPDQSESVLPSISVRATEYTVGPDGPAAMPGDLPPTSAYTYAVEYSVDEAIAAGAERVEFDTPVISYTTNFLDFPVGSAVPVGAYDRTRAVWTPEPNGIVVGFVAETAGAADLDLTGDGVADPAQYAARGIDTDERTALADSFDVGDELWRVPVEHFTPWDCNWPWGPPPDAEPPLDEPIDPEVDPDACRSAGSILECQSQVLGESVPIVGTPFTLEYRSDRVPGRVASYTMNLGTTAESLPTSLSRIDVSLEVAGRVIQQELTPSAGQSMSVTWDGVDAFGRRPQGPVAASICVGYVYPGSYEAPNGPAAFGLAGTGVITADTDRFEATFTRCYGRDSVAGGMIAYGPGSIRPHNTSDGYRLGVFDARASAAALGGWTLSIHHTLAVEAGILYLGTGDNRTQVQTTEAIETVFNGAVSSLNTATGIAVAPDGSLLVSQTEGGERVRRIATDGTISTVAGTLQFCAFAGDGGPATAARLCNPEGVAVALDGSVLIADAGNHRVRRVDPQGIITTIAGVGTGGFAGDGGPATAAQVSFPMDIAVAPDGSLFVASHSATVGRVRRIAPDGTISTYAGGACTAGPPEGKRATGDCFTSVSALALAPDGSLYLAADDSSTIATETVYRISPSGMVERVAGGGAPMEGIGDGLPATSARLFNVQDLELSPLGTLYIADAGSGGSPQYRRIRAVTPGGAIRTLAGTGASGSEDGDGGPAVAANLGIPEALVLGHDRALYVVSSSAVARVRRISGVNFGPDSGDAPLVLSRDHREIYSFDDDGRHLSTMDSLTGVTIWTFGYDPEGRLETVTDTLGGVTTIERDGAGEATAIVSPDGHETTLVVPAGGWLASLTNPAAETYAFEYGNEGLLTSFSTPNQEESTYGYDTLGRLVSAADPEGGSKTLARTELNDGGYEVSLTTGMGRVTSYRIETLPEGGMRYVDTTTDGNQTQTVASPEGSAVVTYPDGTILEREIVPDARFGMQAPAESAVTVTTPGGRQMEVSEVTSVTLADPDDPLSMTAAHQTLVVNGRTWTSTWDAASGLLVTVSPEGRESYIALDAIGEVAEMAASGRAPVAVAHDLRGRPESFTAGTGASSRLFEMVYDAGGFVESIVDPLGRSTNFVLDPIGRITSELPPGSASTQVAYDTNGSIESVTPPTRPAHGFTYDATARLSGYLPPALASVPTTETTFAYDVDHQLTSMVLPDGAIIELTYAAASGRLQEIDTPLGTYVLTHDAAGRVAQVTDPQGGSLTFGHDGPLRTSETWAGDVDGTVQWSYDDDLRVVAEAVNASAPIVFAYDDDGLLTGAGDEIVLRDAASGQVVGATVGTSTLDVVYDDFGDATSMDYAMGGTPLFSATYEVDGLGRITTLTESVADGPERTLEYEYDTAGMLVAVTEDGLLLASYDFDANGNRESVTTGAGTVAATFDVQDRIATHGTTEFVFSANGELAERTDTATDETTTYDYDMFGNLRGVELPDGTSIEYVIDARSRRVGKRIDGVLERGWVYADRLRPIAELDGSGNIAARFVYAARDQVPDYMVRGGTRYRFVTDHLGSVRLVVNLDTGAIEQRLDYGPWGEVTLDTNPGFQPFGYAGGLYDPDTGLVRFGARDYDSTTGRWTTKDPIGFDGGTTNLYAYVGGDPINATDPTGLYSWWNFMNDATNGISAFGDTLSFGATSWARDKLGLSDVVDKCSGAYGGGELAGNLFGLGFGAAHIGRNLLAQGGRLGRMAYDPRTWGSVRRTWSRAAGGLAPKGQSLHHWLIPQRWTWVPQGIRNAGFNYLPLTAKFNSWMNSSTLARSAAEWGMKLMIVSIYGGATGGPGGRCDCD